MFLYELSDWLLDGGKVDCDGFTLMEKDGILIHADTLQPVPASIHYSMLNPNWNKLDFTLAMELGSWYSCSDGQKYKVVDINIPSNKGMRAIARSENGKYLLLCSMGGRGRQSYLTAKITDPQTEIQMGE